MVNSKPPSNPDEQSGTGKISGWFFSPDQDAAEKHLENPNIQKSGLLDLDFTNLLLGATWGIVSGYSSEAFFAPVPDKVKILQRMGSLSHFSFAKLASTRKWIYPTVVAIRISRRAIVSALLFDQTERRMANNFGLNRTLSSLVGFTALSFFFKLSTDIHDAVLGTAVAFGGYLAGSQIAKNIDQYKNSRTKTGKED